MNLTTGLIGISLHPTLSEASNPFDPNHGASELRSNEFSFGLFADPIAVDGDFSDQVKIEAGQNLTPMTDLEKNMLRGKECTMIQDCVKLMIQRKWQSDFRIF